MLSPMHETNPNAACPSLTLPLYRPRKRMTFFSLRICGLFALLLAAPNAPAETMTVDQLVRQALERNPALRMAETEIVSARGERVSAGAWQNPEFSAEVGAKEARDSEDILQGNGIAFSVQLSQTFEWPGKATLRKAIAERNIVIAELALEQFRRALEARVRGLAAELASLDEMRRLASAAASEGKKIVQALNERPRAGAQQTIEIRLIEAATIDLRKTALELETQASALRVELNLLRGFPSFSPLQIDASSHRIGSPGDLQSLLTSGGANHPQVRLRALELENAGHRLRQARLSGAPDISVGPFLSREEAGDVETTIGAAISLPLPLWNQGRGEIEYAKARKEYSEAALIMAQREAETEITKLHREWVSAHQLLEELTPARVQEFQEAAELASRQFRTGGIPVQLFLDMQRESLAVATARQDALATALRNAAALEQLTAPPAATQISGSKPQKTQTRKKP